MAESFEAQIRRLSAELSGLSGKVVAKALKAGIRTAAREVGAAIKEAAPVSSGEPPKGKGGMFPLPGALRHLIRVRRTVIKGDTLSAKISGPWYWRLVERGHRLTTHFIRRATNPELFARLARGLPNSARRRRVPGSEVGKVPPNNFVERAVEGSRDAVMGNLRQAAIKAMENELKRRGA